MGKTEKSQFGNVLKYIRTNRDLSLREFAKLCEFSPAYIADLEKNNRKPSVEVIKRIKEKIFVTQEEQKMMMGAFAHDRLEIPDDLLYYLIDNDLIESLKILKEADKDGQKIKSLALSLNINNNCK